MQAREKLLREDARRADLDPVFDGFASCSSDLVDGHHAFDIRTPARGPQVEDEIVGTVAHDRSHPSLWNIWERRDEFGIAFTSRAFAFHAKHHDPFG